jgi:hypothetical protein
LAARAEVRLDCEAAGPRAAKAVRQQFVDGKSRTGRVVVDRDGIEQVHLMTRGDSRVGQVRAALGC